MTNPIRGEVPLACGARTYTLVFDFNALCTLESALNKKANEIVQMLAGEVSGDMVRTLVWAGLQEYWPEVELRQAGRVVGEAGVQTCLDKVIESFRLAFPRPEDANATEDPPKSPAKARKVGTGKASSRRGASSS